MRRLTTLLVAVALFIGSLLGNQMTVRAEETKKEEISVEDKLAYYASLQKQSSMEENTKPAYELCYLASSWEEYKIAFEQFEPERDDTTGRVLKKLPENLEGLSTFSACGVAIEDEDADELKEAIEHAVSLYNQQGILTFSVSKREIEGPNDGISITANKEKLTHLGNVVLSAKVPYYKDIDDCRKQKNAYYYQKQILCYTCKVEYWNPDGTLEKVDEIPFEKLATLKDTEKKQIDTEFDGTTIVLLCTTDEILGWANIEELYQYEDAYGNMEFYNPEFIKYYEE